MSALDDAYRALNPDQPLTRGDVDPQYVDFAPVRGGEEGDLVNVIGRRIRRSDHPEKQIVTGHRGCGKSTELYRLKHHLENNNYFVVYVNAETGLDLNDVDYPDIFLAIATEVVQQIQRDGPVEINASLLGNVQNWFATEVKTTSEVVGKEAKLAAEASSGGGALGFLKLLASVQAMMRGSHEARTEIRAELEKHGSTLIHHVNQLVQDAEVRLRQAGKAGLVLILDGLEKIIYREQNSTNSHEMLFVHHGEQLKALDCHTIYTMPISLLSSRNVGQIFTQPSVIPMVKIREEDGGPCDEGRALLRETITRRVPNPDVLEAPGLIDPLVEASGGHLRDLLRLVRYAIDLTDEQILPRHVERAIAKLTDEYDRLVRDEALPCLVQVHQDHQVPGTHQADLLLYDLLLLEYQNGHRWGDVHPCVQKTRKFRAKLEAK